MKDPDQDPLLASEAAERFRNALRDLHATPRLSEAQQAELDARVAAKARGMRLRMVLRRRGSAILAGGVAAAILCLGGWLLLFNSPPYAPEDVDRSGHVDIRDAYLLARQVHLNDQQDPRHDLNKDGRVDEADVTLIARTAVALTTEVTP